MKHYSTFTSIIKWLKQYYQFIPEIVSTDLTVVQHVNLNHYPMSAHHLACNYGDANIAKLPNPAN